MMDTEEMRGSFDWPKDVELKIYSGFTDEEYVYKFGVAIVGDKKWDEDKHPRINVRVCDDGALVAKIDSDWGRDQLDETGLTNEIIVFCGRCALDMRENPPEEDDE